MSFFIFVIRQVRPTSVWYKPYILHVFALPAHNYNICLLLPCFVYIRYQRKLPS